MRHSDELDEIFRRYWNRMSENTRALAKETLQQAQKSEEIEERKKEYKEGQFLDEEPPFYFK